MPGSTPLPSWAPVVFGTFLAIAAVNRPNQVLGIGLLLALWIVYRLQTGTDRRLAWREIATASILFLAITLLPLLHNIYYGSQFIIFSLGAAQNPDTYYFPLNQLPELLHSSEAREIFFVDQLGRILAWPSVVIPQIGVVATLFFNFILLAAIIGLARGARRREWHAFSITLLAFGAFAGVYAFYKVDSYFPRHIVVAYVILAFCAAYLLRKPRQDRRME